MDSHSDLRNTVDQLLQVFQQGYEPFVVTAIKSVHGTSWLDVLKNTPDLRMNTQQQPLRLDATALVRVMLYHWDSTFSRVLTVTERSMLFEVRHIRNKWAHQSIIQIDDVDRLADNVVRLLVAINAANADYAKQLRESLRVRRYRRTQSTPTWLIVSVVVMVLGLGGIGWWMWGQTNTSGKGIVSPPVTATYTPTANSADNAFPCQLGQIKANPRTMIYHLPDGTYYASTKNSDVRCFDTVDAVELAGFRKAKR